MIAFDDFDAWGDAVSGAHLRLACDSVQTPLWTLDRIDLGRVGLQVAFEGGGNICYGANAHHGPMLFIPLSHAAGHIVNGEPLDDESLFLIPEGSDFSIRVRERAHAWCSIALPADEVVGLGGLSSSTRLVGTAGAVPRMRQLVTAITASLGGQPSGSAAHTQAGNKLVAAIRDSAPQALPPRTVLGRPRCDRAMIIRRAMEAIEQSEVMPTAADLAQRVGVTSRTLLRTMHEAFGMPPKRYLMYRELHAVRRSLCAGAADEMTVADVLTRHGIWEFGRFAARYRRHFGELPSATLRHRRS